MVSVRCGSLARSAFRNRARRRRRRLGDEHRARARRGDRKHTRESASSPASKRSSKPAVAQALNLVERQIAALSRQQLAGTTGQALLDRAESLRILAQLSGWRRPVVAAGMIPSSPSRQSQAQHRLGLLLGFCSAWRAFLLERLDRRMKTVEDLEAAYRLPLLAASRIASPTRSLQQRRHSGHSGEQEVFRLLRAYLRYFNVDREVRSLLVVSAAPGDGKTTRRTQSRRGCAGDGYQDASDRGRSAAAQIGTYYGCCRLRGSQSF